MSERIFSTPGRRLPIGAEVLPHGGVSFRVWAPKCKQIKVLFDDGRSIPMLADNEGYFGAVCPWAKDGTTYHFLLDGDDKPIPDPASRFQPQGVHGASQVVDPARFHWSDEKWEGIKADGQVLYELHLGTFTPEGTWLSAIEKLADLKAIGITCLEVMPIAEFAGDFGWGYDGVDLFAPTRAYGSPDDVQKFVDAAHAIGLAVILDVVYNHFGPDGNYLKRFSDTYFTLKRANDWGESINFDDTGSGGVRDFFIANASYWISEYHFDGFRFDATQAILDDSPDHILAAITRAAREAAGKRSIYLITENEPQLTRIVRPANQAGFGMDGLWNDDFHHSVMVALSGRNEAYFTDYQGKPQEFISALKWGYLFQGQLSAWQMKRRGTPTTGLKPSAFVNYIQNHDQIANFGHGERAHQLSGLAQFKAATVLLLLAPQTPLLFQGQEFAASSPFQYFADHTGELPDLIRKGRLKEFRQFPSHDHPDMQSAMCDPCNRDTFLHCKLDWEQRSKGWHRRVHDLHKELLLLRHNDPVFSSVHTTGQIDGAVIGPDAFVLKYFSDAGERLVLINFGADLHLRVLPEPLLAAPPQMRWEIMLSSESPRFGGTGLAPIDTRGQDWRLPGVNFELAGRCAVVLKPVPLTDVEATEYDRLEKEREAVRQKGLAAE